MSSISSSASNSSRYGRLSSPLRSPSNRGTWVPLVMKPVTALAGLRAGLITPGTVVDDRGTYRLGTRILQNAQGKAHGRVDLARALAVSSDVYFYGLGDRLYSPGSPGPSGASPAPPATAPDGPIQDIAGRLGFGRPTGIDIGPDGSVPERTNYEVQIAKDVS